MSRSIAPSVRVGRWLRAAPLVAAVACGGPQSLAGAGAECFRDDECEAGLICVAPTEDDINRVCSSDPSPLISNVEGPPPIMEPMGGSAGAAGANAGGGAGAVAGGGTGALAGNAGNGASAGAGGTETAGSAGSGGSGGTDTAGSGGSAGNGGSAGSGGSEPEGGAAT